MFGTTDELRFTVDLSKPRQRMAVSDLQFTGDNAGTSIVFSFVDAEGSAVNVGQCLARLYVIRPDGVTVLLSGEVSGDRAWFTLAQACVEVPGGAELHLALTSGDTVKFVWSADAVIHRSSTDSYADPSNIIPDINAIIAQYEACVRATNSANDAVANANVAIASMQAEMETLRNIIDQVRASCHHYVQAGQPDGAVEGDFWTALTGQTWGDVSSRTWQSVSAGTWRDLASISTGAIKQYIAGQWVALTV